MGFPSEKELARVRKKLEKVDGTLALRPNASSLEKFRWDLCQKFVKFKRENNLTLEEMLALVNFGLNVDQEQFRMVMLPGRFSTPDESIASESSSVAPGRPISSANGSTAPLRITAVVS